MKKRYATATGIYNEEDFGGPPPMPFDEVYDAAPVDELISTLATYLEFSSIDGKAERQLLRAKLKALLANAPTT